MKKIVYIILFIIVLILGIKFEKNEVQIENIKYKIYVNGKKTASFPKKGNYSVEVKCNNTSAYWDYANWKLQLNDIIANTDSCIIEFKISQRDNISEYIKSLENKDVGNGKLKSDKLSTINNASKISSSEYLSSSQYSSSSPTDTSGTTVSDIFKISGDTWNMSTNTSLVSEKTYYNFQFKVPLNGTYQICYNVYFDNNNPPAFGDYTNNIYFYVNNTEIYNKHFSNTSITDCILTGQLTAGTNFRISRSILKNYGNIDSFKFYVEKGDEVLQNTGYRYIEKDPNNYVFYNNELWRIIGTFETTLADGTTKQWLTKIIRENPIGSFNQSTGLNYLKDYYNSDGTNEMGLNSKSRELVENVFWNQGEYTSTDDPAKLFQVETQSTIGPKYIGLLAPSDYLYAGKVNSWLHSNVEELTIGNYITIGYTGNIYSVLSYGTTYRYNFRPVLYLKSDVYIFAGTGTRENPYILGCDTCS